MILIKYIKLELLSRYYREYGCDLYAIKGEPDYATWEIDFFPIIPVCREHRFYKKVCTCGCCPRV